MFEHHKQPLLSRQAFLRRILTFALGAFCILLISWLIGIIGYEGFEQMSWIDAMLNAAMILGGMGQVNPLYTNAGKIFASFYALFSGVVFLVSTGVLLAPVVHRLFHKFHIQNDEN